MGACSDSSVTFLRDVGYNVVRHPNAAIKPLDLIGVQKGEALYLGPLNLLITNPPGALPRITRDTVAAQINGQKSSALKIGLGVNVLASIVGAMGGNLGLTTNYTNARQIKFSYSNVLNDFVIPLEVGNYLRDADVDAGNLILKEYVLGKGELYIIVKTAKSNRVDVLFERNSGVAASIDVPVIQGVAGGSLKVETSNVASGQITFSGPQNLVFAFQAFQIGVKDGSLNLVSVEAGGVAFGQGEVAGSSILNPTGLLQLSGF